MTRIVGALLVAAPFALAAAHPMPGPLDLSRPDTIPERALNDILYEAIRNRRSPGPIVRFGVADARPDRDDDD